METFVYCVLETYESVEQVVKICKLEKDADKFRDKRRLENSTERLKSGFYVKRFKLH